MPVNVQLSQGNFSLGPESGFFYTVSYATSALLKVEADGSVVGSFPLTNSILRGEVTELAYDGTFFWTLENLPSNLGIVIKKWRLYPVKTFAFPSVTPSECRWQDELTLIHGPSIKWESRAFGVEHYHRTLDGSFIRGATSITLNDVSYIAIGDSLYMGPSSFGGFIGNEEVIVVTGKTGNTLYFSKAGGLENSYTSTNPVDVSKALWVFNDHSFSGLEDDRGALVKFTLPEKHVALVDEGMQYAKVNSADFDQETLVFVRGDQILRINTNTSPFSITSSMEANLRESDLATPLIVYDLIADLGGNIVYKLQQKETTEDVGTGIYSTTSFSPNYNFQTIATLPFVNSVAIRCNQRSTFPFATADKINIVAEVRDQYNLPVFNETVQFTATLNVDSGAGVPGTFSPSTAITNISGTVATQYTPSITQDLILIDIKAQVT